MQLCVSCLYVTILCSDIYFVVCFGFRLAAASDVTENAMRVPVVNHSIDRSTGDHCTAVFTGLVIEVDLENYPEVKLEDASESYTCSNVAKSVADATDESCSKTCRLDTAPEDQCTSEFTSSVNDDKLENCPDVSVEAVEENAMEYPDISVNVRVHAIHI